MKLTTCEIQARFIRSGEGGQGRYTIRPSQLGIGDLDGPPPVGCFGSPLYKR